MGDRRLQLELIFDAARKALANHEPPPPEVLGQVQAGLAGVKTPLTGVPQPAAASVTGRPLHTRRRAG